MLVVLEYTFFTSLFCGFYIIILQRLNGVALTYYHGLALRLP